MDLSCTHLLLQATVQRSPRCGMTCLFQLHALFKSCLHLAAATGMSFSQKERTITGTLHQNNNEVPGGGTFQRCRGHGARPEGLKVGGAPTDHPAVSGAHLKAHQ